MALGSDVSVQWLIMQIMREKKKKISLAYIIWTLAKNGNNMEK